jgi:hypothetical protein
MCLSPKDITVETDRSTGSTLIEFEVEMATQPFTDTIPCPPPDWVDLEPE